MSILGETKGLAGQAWLTVCLRDEGRAPDLARLRVFRLDPAAGLGDDLKLGAADFKLGELGRGRLSCKAISFPIDRFGTYLLAEEKAR